MVDNLRFGAINKRTDKWEDPTQASKKNKTHSYTVVAKGTRSPCL